MSFQEREGASGGKIDQATTFEAMRTLAGSMLGKLSPEIIETGLDISKELIPAMLRDSQKSFDQAAQADGINRELGAMTITLSLIQESTDAYVEDAVSEVLKNPTRKNLLTFAFFYDFASGMKSIAGTLWGAQRTIAGTFEKDLGAETDIVLEGLSPEKQAETILFIGREIEIFADLLKQDRTGFSAVDAAVEWMEEGSIPIFNKEWFVAGARGAREIYKQIYPQAAALLKPQ